MSSVPQIPRWPLFKDGYYLISNLCSSEMTSVFLGTDLHFVLSHSLEINDRSIWACFYSDNFTVCKWYKYSRTRNHPLPKHKLPLELLAAPLFVHPGDFLERGIRYQTDLLQPGGSGENCADRSFAQTGALG